MNLQNLLPQWQTTDQLPITLLYGGRPIRGIPSEWNPKVTVRRIDCSITETTVVGVSPEGLELRMECRSYQDFAAVEYTGYITNRADADSPLVENIRLAGMIPGSNASLYHGNGDTCHENGYEWWTTQIGQSPLTVEPCGDGTSCNGAFPYMRLMLADRGVNIAVGWTGIWTADFTQTDTGTAFCVGQKRCHMVIHPGETMRVPSLTLVAYAGGEDEGRNTWRRWYFAHILPKQDHKLLEPKCCMLLFQAEGKPEFTGATEKNQIAAMEAFLRSGLQPDVWWIDAGWYPCGYVWHHTGNWYPDPDRFPRGLKPIGDKCREHNMEFLLWFEPERIQEGTRFDREHPQWLLYFINKEGQVVANRLVDLGNRDCCDHVIDLLDGIIKESGVNIYRQDYNGPWLAGKVWQREEAEDRIGAKENLHIQGYYRLWDTLLARNPGLIIDSCASGGRRNDIETMRRSIALHYTDVGYGNHPVKLKQHRQMFEWIPYFRAHNENWCAEDGSYDKQSRLPDRYSYYVAMAPALTDITEYNADEDALALAREMQAIWREAARRMIGTDYYPLTLCRKSSDDFYAAQFHDPATQQGILHLINGSTATQTQFVVMLKGVEPEMQYVLRSAEQKREWVCSGAELLAGIPVTLAKKTGDIWFYERK